VLASIFALAWSAQGDGYAYFNGVIDNVAFFGSALSDEEVASLCAATNGGVPCHYAGSDLAFFESC
jgi:hypothetical protein